MRYNRQMRRGGVVANVSEDGLRPSWGGGSSPGWSIVGSTAVPGLAAKPILDLQAAVADLRCAPSIAAVLGPEHWHYVDPDLDARPWRRFFIKASDGHRVAHLHVMTLGSARWSEQLAFRDALRADRRLVESYAAMKVALAAQHADDREAYSAAKYLLHPSCPRARHNQRK